MTVITIATIGYSEVIDIAHRPGGRIFTMFLAFSGIGILTYVFSSITAFAVEGELKETFRRRKMDKMIKKLKNHFIVCRIEGVGFHITTELSETQRPFVIIETDRIKIERLLEMFPNLVYIEGDATDDNNLLKAGIERARGLFAAMGDDHKNLVISLTARQLNPEIRIVASCCEPINKGKMKKAGADAVILPTYIGGLRMASEMIRPAAVSFLDTMLRDEYKDLRIEDLPVSESFIGKPISSLNIDKYHNTLLLAIKTKSGWIYKPPESYTIKPDNTLILMTTPNERKEIENTIIRI
jgi:voltage-gated potassium channel